MTESEFQKYKEKAIEQDVLAVENRIRHAFNQGVECGRRLFGLGVVIERQKILNRDAVFANLVEGMESTE